MPDTPPLTPLPFAEAIAWARARRVVLPADYYGTLQGLARAQAFTIAGLNDLDQLQAVHDSLTAVLQSGDTFSTWKARVLAGEIPLDRSEAVLETIFRNNIQQSYNRGRYEQQAAAVGSHPWWMYDAINDSRTRPSHAAMDGMTARHDDPIWDTWSPACGHRCRCRRIALTDAQGQKALEADAARWGDPAKQAERAQHQPDPGWGHNLLKEPNRGLAKAIETRQGACRASPRLAVRGRPDDAALWCQHAPLAAALDDMRATLGAWQDQSRLLRAVLTPADYNRLADAARDAAAAFGLAEPQGVMLRAYTDRALDAWPLVNRLARALPHSGPLGLTDADIYRAGIMVQVMDAALANLPVRAGLYARGINPDGLGARRQPFVAAHTHPGRRVVWEGYTSVMAGSPYAASVQCIITAQSARDLAPFSVIGEPELVLPRGTRLIVGESLRIDDTLLIDLAETDDDRPIPARYRFSLGD